MRLIVFLLTILCYDTPSLTCAKAELPRDTSRATPRRFGKLLTKRQDDLGYLEQCSILQFWDKQIGRVNVLAFFDSTWPFSHRQAAMLKVLRERFDKTGFENIQFLAINAAPGESEYVSRSEIEVEEETWKQISPSEADGVPPIVPSAETLAAALGPDVYFIQDTAELQIWPKLRAFRDQILVIDRCGRLTYQVIVPWSILHFPYVKAAILSTYKDEPCGHCERTFDDSTENSQTEENAASADRTTTSARDRDEQDVEPTAIAGTTTDAPASVIEGGNDTSSSAERQSELLFSQSGDDYDDAQTVTPTTLTPTIDANEPTATPSSPTLMPRDNAISSIDTTPTTTTGSGTTILAVEQQTDDNIYGETITVPSADAEYSTYTSQSDNYYDVTRVPDETETDASLPPNNASIRVNYTDGITDAYSREDDYSNVTENHYEDLGDFNFTSASTMPDYEAINTETVTEHLDELTLNVTDGGQVNPATTNSSSSESNAERRLTEPKEIESLDARDVLKSRSTNARSVSPNDGTDNQLQVIEAKSEAATSSESRKDEGQLEADYLIPIRIIMRAPHVDEYSDRSLKAHEYLVLKTGQPSYHEHLADLEHEHDHDQQQQQQQQHKPVQKKAEAVKSTFARDESPGLYGELADYWQNYGNEHSHDDGSDSASGSLEDDDHEHVLEQEQSFVAEGSATAKPSTLLNEHAKALESDNEQHYDDHSTSYEDADVIDEEAKSKLIAHYSKLLPWLYYVLAK